MKKNLLIFCLIFLNTVYFSWGQVTDKQYNKSTNQDIVKLTYTSSPVSPYRMTESDTRSSATRASIYDYMNGITDYYSLYINLKDRSSVYVLDSTSQVRPLGWEDPNMNVTVMDSVLFAIKTPSNKTLKHEWVMHQTFYTEGNVGDIKWELTNEEKVIDGINSKKAIAKEDNYPTLTVWYTNDLPVSNGPSIYQGLPGLVVRAEDYSRTIELINIEYSNNVEEFKKVYDEKFEAFSKEKTKKKHYEIEPILIIKKGDLFKSSYEYFHKKPYKRSQ